MAVFSSGYCKVTGLAKGQPAPFFIPMMPVLSQNEQAQLFGCKITLASHMEHNYVPIIEFGKGKGLGVKSCKITGHVAETISRPVPLPEETTEVKHVHRFKKGLRYMEPFLSRLANPGEKAVMESLVEKMGSTTEMDSSHSFVYTLHDRRTGKAGIVVPHTYEEAIRSGTIESIMLSGDSNSLVVRLREGPICTIPMDKMSKPQIERMVEDDMLFDGQGPDREVIEAQRREKAAKEQENRDQMALYLHEMEKKRAEREKRKQENMKQMMMKKMAENEEAERRQKEVDEEIKKQYQEAARVRAEAEAAKAAAREERLAERERKEAEAKARRAEELAREAEEKARQEEERRMAEEQARKEEEEAAAAALSRVNPAEMSVNELLEHMRENAGDKELLEEMEEAASTGMSSKQIVDMISKTAMEAIEEKFAESEEEEGEEEEEESDESEEESEEDTPAEQVTSNLQPSTNITAPSEEPDAVLEPEVEVEEDPFPEELSEEEKERLEEERRLKEEQKRREEEEAEILRQQMEELRQEELERKRLEREAKRLERQRKREEQEAKEEEKRLAKEAREQKKQEMYERMAAIRKADAEEEAERMKKPEKREPPVIEIKRKKTVPDEETTESTETTSEEDQPNGDVNKNTDDEGEETEYCEEKDDEEDQDVELEQGDETSEEEYESDDVTESFVGDEEDEDEEMFDDRKTASVLSDETPLSIPSSENSTESYADDADSIIQSDSEDEKEIEPLKASSTEERSQTIDNGAGALGERDQEKESESSEHNTETRTSENVIKTKEEEEIEAAARQEELERKRLEREAKRLERQRKREEQDAKEEEKRLAKEAREQKRKETNERMAALRKAEAEEDAERMKKPEKREAPVVEIKRRNKETSERTPTRRKSADEQETQSSKKSARGEVSIDERSGNSRKDENERRTAIPKTDSRPKDKMQPLTMSSAEETDELVQSDAEHNDEECEKSQSKDTEIVSSVLRKERNIEPDINESKTEINPPKKVAKTKEEEEQEEADIQMELEKKRSEREAKRLERQRKRQELAAKEEEKKSSKEARERKRKETSERMNALRKADAEEEAERMKKPEKREAKVPEIKRRKPTKTKTEDETTANEASNSSKSQKSANKKAPAETSGRKKRPPNLQIPAEPEAAEYVIQTTDGRTVVTEEELDEMSVVEGRISPDGRTGKSKLTPGRALRTERGVEFVAGKMMSTKDGEEFVPGKAVDLPVGAKFVPGQTVSTKHGPQFVAGKTIGEGNEVQFVPGHVVNLGGKAGEVFVPGQVMQTDKGLKFIPGSVYKSAAGPLFVPGKVIDGQFTPGQIVETETGPRFVAAAAEPEPEEEEVINYVVQSFDLDPLEMDLVQYQYHSPEPSPTFKGQTIRESLDLLQLAAKGHRAKTIPPPVVRPPPPRSKRQIYESVSATLLDCIARVSRAAAGGRPPRECLRQEAKRVQRVLADDLNNPLPLSDVTAFLKSCLALPSPCDEVAQWTDGLFGYSEEGVFRRLQPMVNRKLSRKVSLQKTLSEVARQAPVELERALTQDNVLAGLVHLTKKEMPRRTHVNDQRERWQEMISAIILTSGKVILNDVFNSVAYGDEDFVRVVLQDVLPKVTDLASDPVAVSALERSIHQYVMTGTERRLDNLVTACRDPTPLQRAGLSQHVLLNEAVGLATLEGETAAGRLLQQCVASPALTLLLPLHTTCAQLLRTVLMLHTLAEHDERRQGYLHDLAKYPSVLRENLQWVRFLSGAKLVSEHDSPKRRRLRTTACIPGEVLQLLTREPSAGLESAIHEIVADSARHVYAVEEGQTRPPVVILKQHFEGIIPREQARDVINGKVQYLLVDETGVRLFRVGEVEPHREERLRRASQWATQGTANGETVCGDVTNGVTDTVNGEKEPLAESETKVKSNAEKAGAKGKEKAPGVKGKPPPAGKTGKSPGARARKTGAVASPGKMAADISSAVTDNVDSSPPVSNDDITKDGENKTDDRQDDGVSVKLIGDMSPKSIDTDQATAQTGQVTNGSIDMNIGNTSTEVEST